MDTEKPDLYALQDRIEVLERQNGRMKRAGIAALALMVAVSTLGQAAPKKNRVVEAEQFIVRDAKGRQRALLGLDHPESVDHSPVRIGLYNEAKSSAVMYLSNGFAGISITAGGEKGKPPRAIQLYANPQEGTGMKVGRTLVKTAAQINVDQAGTAAFTLKDDAGKVVFKAP
jgi:hypothetical protein